MSCLSLREVAEILGIYSPSVANVIVPKEVRPPITAKESVASRPRASGIAKTPKYYSKPAKESNISGGIIQYIKGVGGHAIKVSQDEKQAGEPDISGCYRGNCLKLETKRPGNKPTPRQASALARWAKAGAIAQVVTNLDQVKEIIREIDSAWQACNQGTTEVEARL